MVVKVIRNPKDLPDWLKGKVEFGKGAVILLSEFGDYKILNNPSEEKIKEEREKFERAIFLTQTG